jgi:hypothetical protein
VADFNAPSRQRLAQQAFDLGIHTPQVARRRTLDRRVEQRVEAQGEGLPGISHVIDRANRY